LRWFYFFYKKIGLGFLRAKIQAQLLVERVWIFSSQAKMSQYLHQRGAKNGVYPDFVEDRSALHEYFRNEVGVNFGHLQRE
jgi:hypothetical protein